MVFKATVNKEKALLLKKLGWDCNDISEELGCSRVWCSKNLVGIEKDKEFMKKAYEFVKDSSDLQDTFPFFCTEEEIKFILQTRDNTVER